MMRALCFTLLFLLWVSPTTFVCGQQLPPKEKPRPRLRELGIRIGVLPTGAMNAITDVGGVQIGHQTIVEGDSVRTGVTAVVPHADNLFLNNAPAAVHVANGFGKFVGTTQIAELGVIESPILLTNTLSTFAVADALAGWILEQPGCESVRSVNPVVGECNDGFLNDIRQRRVSKQDVVAALTNARGGPVKEGCVGAGVGVRCMGWKGGIGTSSRQLPSSLGGYTVGVLVQTNFGGSLTVAGAPVGRELGRYYLKDEVKTQEHGSCIVIVATDAPLDARRLRRLAKRAPLGLAAVGSPISHGSGDYVVAFSTAKHLRSSYQSEQPMESSELLRDDRLSPLFQAVRDATEEAVINSMLQAVTTTGHRGRTVDAIDPQRVAEICKKYKVGKDANATEVGRSTSTIRSKQRTYGEEMMTASLQKKIEQIEARLPKLMDDHHVPGVSVALIEDRRLVWSRGYGVRCAGTEHPVQPDTVMEACSMSKPFFAYMFLKLVEQNTMDLNRPLVEYLSMEDLEGLETDPRHRRITAEMALTHTTGLPNWRQGGWRSDTPLSLAFMPGTKFRYSGEGFLMLQRAVERAVGSDLDSLSREKLIKPLDLKNSRYVWDDQLMVNAACGHDREGAVKSDRTYYDRANAAYSLYTSAEDYARFIEEILKSDRTSEHSLSNEMRDKMLSPVSHREDQDADWGLGWGLRTPARQKGAEPTESDSRPTAFHSGANGTGFRCYSEFSRETGDGIVIMTNAIGGAKLWAAVIESRE